jgi:hypothetical protein
LKRKKDEKARDNVYTEDLKQLKQKLRMENNAKKEMEEKIRSEKKRKHKPAESPSKPAEAKK